MLFSYYTASRISFLIILSAFGIYLTAAPGIRVDQLVTYFLLIFALPLLLLSPRKKHNLYPTLFAFSWLILAFFIIIRSAPNISKDFSGSIPQTEALTQTSAILIIAMALIQGRNHTQLLKIFKNSVNLTLLLLSANTLLLSITFFYDTWPILKIFNGQWHLPIENSKVWVRTLSVDRHVGIFNMPFESGLAYSIGLLLCVWATIRKILSPPLILISLAAIIVGGAASGSKVFVFLGIPLSALYSTLYSIIHLKKNPHIIIFQMIIVVIILVGFGFWVIYAESGISSTLFASDYITNSSILQVISGGRFGKDQQTNVEAAFLLAWDHKYLGQGLPLDFAFDNAYLQIFAYGGLFAIFLYGIFVLAPVLIGLKTIRKQSEDALLLLFLSALVIAAGMGAPVFLINRVSILISLVLLLLCTLTTTRNSPPPQNAEIANEDPKTRSIRTA